MYSRCINKALKRQNFSHPLVTRGALCASPGAGAADREVARCGGHLWRRHRLGGSHSLPRDAFCIAGPVRDKQI